MSVRKNDPGFVNLRYGSVVTVDGQKQEHCFTADEELSEAWCYAIGEDGNPIINHETKELVIEHKRGNVVIVLPPTDRTIGG